ncbi:hypothetical protein KIW84_062716 [Lathyrus oleraceus]|uniref:Uncharacterized protein n=1 Tax=Pisum sativum TaxID=3888 RepID=A0A9D4W803_PEA|nr:hypothetical protein KIW84_062716 [Pisum sativum]
MSFLISDVYCVDIFFAKEIVNCTAAGTGIAGGTTCVASSFGVVTKGFDERKVLTGGAQIKCVGDDIEDLEFTPKPEFEGCFKVTNVQNEVAIATLAIAGLYIILSPLGKDYDCEMDEESRDQILKPFDKKYAFAFKDQQGEVIELENRQNWSGGILEIWHDIFVSFLSLFCIF